MRIGKVFSIFLIWLAAVNFFALVAAARFNFLPDSAYSWMSQANPAPQIAATLHAKWDSLWYIDIARNGYSYRGAEQLSNMVFPPLYPVLVRTFSFLTPGNFSAAGFLVSIISLFFALAVLAKIVKEFHKSIDPASPILFLLIFPAAFFLNAVYSESLFLLLSLLVFYFALKRNFLLAGLLGFLAALTRVTGVLLFIPVIWELFAVREKFKVGDFLAPFLIPLGTLAFMFYEYLRFGDFALLLKVESWWGHSLGVNYSQYVLPTAAGRANFYLDFLALIFLIVITVLVFIKLRASYGVYMLLFLIAIIFSGTLMSIGRYALVLFPIYILAALFKNKFLQFGWAFLSVLLLALNIVLFVNGYWAG